MKCTDVWGLEMTQRKKYFVSFTDEATCYTVIVLMHSKDKTFQAFKDLDVR
jgi:hypothetical protein